jgi:hypothetical protein
MNKKSYDGIKAHYTSEQLDELEALSRTMSRMDLTVKIKLINMARYALKLETENKRYNLDELFKDVTPEAMQKLNQETAWFRK